MDEETLDRLVAARNYLAASSHSPVRLEQAAAVAMMSRHHFHRRFVSAFRTTPHSYHQELRLKEARRLLSFGDADVTEICFELGYSSLGSFSTLFKSQFGISPIEYRRQIHRVFLVNGLRERRRIPSCYLRAQFV